MSGNSRPKIVVVDGFTLSPLSIGETSPDHPAWDALAQLGDVTIYERTSPAELIERCADAEIIITNKVPIRAEHFAQLPKLKNIGVTATGTNIIDLDAAREHGVSVTNVPGYSTMSVAQHVFALMFELAAKIGPTAEAVKSGAWQNCPDFCFTVQPFTELSGKTLGIVGFGAIAQAVAGIGHALGMKIIVQSRTEKPSAIPVEWVSVEQLFKRSDVITLHCPLTPETSNLVNDERIDLMKPTAWIINTGRGPLVDEAAVAAALTEGKLGAFAADVLTAEPPVKGNPLIDAPRTVITPHIAWASIEARHRLMDVVTENVAKFINGEPQNVVN